MVHDVWQTRIHRMKSAIYTHTVRPVTTPLNLLKGCDAHVSLSESPLQPLPMLFLLPRCPFPTTSISTQSNPIHSLRPRSVSLFTVAQLLKGSRCTRRATAVLTRATHCRRLTGGLPLSCEIPEDGLGFSLRLAQNFSEMNGRALNWGCGATRLKHIGRQHRPGAQAAGGGKSDLQGQVPESGPHKAAQGFLQVRGGVSILGWKSPAEAPNYLGTCCNATSLSPTPTTLSWWV